MLLLLLVVDDDDDVGNDDDDDVDAVVSHLRPTRNGLCVYTTDGVACFCRSVSMFFYVLCVCVCATTSLLVSTTII